ncbi:MAG: hypothetical protein JWM82_4112 [Myxococcales bacterium]|nr:hypothetical protein [Myxococcales bacterium]
MTRATRALRIGSLLMLAGTACAPSTIIGPLSHQQEERDRLVLRAITFGMSTDLLEQVMPPLTSEERILADEQDHSCRSSYKWKDGLTWTGSAMVAAAAGLTIGGAYATSNNDMTGKLAFGVSAGTMATLGGGLVALGGIIQERFSDRGCVTKVTVK